MHILQGYEPYLRGFSLDVVDKSGNTCFAIDVDNRIFFYNDAYVKFARENQGDKIVKEWGLGRNILEAIQGPQREFFKVYFAQCISEGCVNTFAYECSSPEVFRLLKMYIYPLKNKNGLFLDHCFLVTKTIDREVACCSRRSYMDEHGLVRQCGHCRRTLNIENNSWDWCPNFLGYRKISHSLCRNCLDHYYPAEEGDE